MKVKAWKKNLLTNSHNLMKKNHKRMISNKFKMENKSNLKIFLISNKKRRRLNR